MSSVRSIKRAREKHQEKLADASLPTSVTATLGEVVTSLGGLRDLAMQPLPAKVSFQVAKVLRAVNHEAEEYERVRKELCERCGTLNEAKTGYDIDVDKQEEFTRELTELGATEVTLSVPPIRLSLIENLPMSSLAMLSLEYLIVE